VVHRSADELIRQLANKEMAMLVQSSDKTKGRLATEIERERYFHDIFSKQCTYCLK